MNKELIELRKNKKMTQPQIAKKIGISQQAYSQIENGLVNPSLETALKIAMVLKTPVEKIFSSKKQD